MVISLKLIGGGILASIIGIYAYNKLTAAPSTINTSPPNDVSKEGNDTSTSTSTSTSTNNTTSSDNNTTTSTSSNNTAQSVNPIFDLPYGVNFGYSITSPQVYKIGNTIVASATISENFNSQNPPVWEIYGSTTGDKNDFHQVAGATPQEMYWNGDGSTGGQADTPSTSFGLSGISYPSGLNGNQMIYLVCVDTANNVRSHIISNEVWVNTTS